MSSVVQKARATHLNYTKEAAISTYQKRNREQSQMANTWEERLLRTCTDYPIRISGKLPVNQLKSTRGLELASHKRLSYADWIANCTKAH